MSKYKQDISKFVKGLENKLTDKVVRASDATIEQNGRKDGKCKGLERRASSKCCSYCMSHEGTYSFASVDSGAMGGKHEACKCKILPVFGKNTSVSARIEEAKNKADIENLALVKQSDSKEFKEALDIMKKASKNGGAVDTHSLEELDTFKKFLSDDKMCGVAIKPDGDIVCVFKNPNSKHKNAIHDLMLTARENGGVKLDCYGKFLVNKYEECGFKPVARVKFNPEYVSDKTLLENKPDVYFMIKTDESTLAVIERIGREQTRHSTQEELMKLPVFKYEDAGKYRDELLK